jgi:hypothetical protein
MVWSIYLSTPPVNPSPAAPSPQFQNDFELTTDATGVFNSTLHRDVPLPVNATVDQLDSIPLSEVQSFKEPALPWYSDQALPFEITAALANEYGAAASCKLFGVEILNEGFGMSIDDSVNEMQAAFVARARWRRAALGKNSFLIFGRNTRCYPRVGPFLPPSSIAAVSLAAAAPKSRPSSTCASIRPGPRPFQAAGPGTGAGAQLAAAGNGECRMTVRPTLPGWGFKIKEGRF